MKKLPLVAILLFSTVFVVGSTCLIGSDSNKSTESMTLAVDGMACEEACATLSSRGWQARGVDTGKVTYSAT